MEIWPAIDLRGGKCVRLRQGDYAQETVFGDDPVAMAQRWLAEGAARLHLVDLDAARDGGAANRAAAAAIARATGLPCQLGGGVREEADITALLGLGLTRLVVGTRAAADPEWFAAMCRRYPGRLVLGLDARDGQLATDGWRRTSGLSALEAAARCADLPLAAIVYTDIARDGMLAGPNFAGLREMKERAAAPVIASGGVTTADDVARLAELGLDGCIVGRALYEGRLTLAEAHAAARGAAPA